MGGFGRGGGKEEVGGLWYFFEVGGCCCWGGVRRHRWRSDCGRIWRAGDIGLAFVVHRSGLVFFIYVLRYVPVATGDGGGG